MTAEAKERAAARRAAARSHGPADSYENRSLMERCITRGLPEVTLPGPYNNNLQIVQTPGYVMLFTEMIHDARVMPMDGRPHNSPELAVVDGRLARPLGRRHAGRRHHNFTDRTNFRGSGANLHLVERFTRVDADTHRIPLHARRSDHLDAALDRRVSDREDRGADLRVRAATRGTTACATSCPARGGRKSTPKKRRRKSRSGAWRRKPTSLLDEMLVAWAYTRDGVIAEVKNLPESALDATAPRQD